jgi:hypothetical protein
MWCLKKLQSLYSITIEDYDSEASGARDEIEGRISEKPIEIDENHRE